MKRITSFASAVCAVLGSLCALALPACAQAGAPAALGAKVTFAKGRVLHFADFDLTYTGTRHVASAQYPRGFDYEDFTVSRGGVSRKVSWSSGTGEIDWADFEFNGKTYALELRLSRSCGRLKEDELVVTRR